MNKYSIYVDLGFRDPTNLVIVNHGPERHQVEFKSLHRHTELDDVIEHIVALMDKYEIAAESVYVPRHPAVEQKLKKIRPQRPQKESPQKLNWR